ncbi:MAG: aminotransferase class I/II-fold pyridoxal phosphate-dependent enzyme [Planctomycetota bacterium]|nr:aminotransferase class I/II-fold pyridoxal phosphate-dependent enzyme [Planctomycetota bacterium]
MKIAPFEMERWQSLHEHDVELNLSDSGVHPLSLRELCELFEEEDTLEALLDQELEYTQTNGRPALRERVAALYPGANADQVEITTGGVEANCIAAWTLVERGDEVITMVPNYGQLPGLVEGLGARVVPWELRPDWEARRWTLDLDELASKIGPRTRMLLLCNPNNPTGAVVEEERISAIVALCERHGVWVLADEIYSGSEFSGPPAASVWGKGERVIVTNSLSKAYGLPGLRLGWIVSNEAAIEDFWTRHDYTTIGPSALSDLLAERVLRPGNRALLIKRTKDWLTHNYKLVATWLAQRPHLGHLPPTAGAMAWVRYDESGHSSMELAERLRREHSLLLVPGEQFGQEGWLRLGFGATAARLEEGLIRLGSALEGLHA